MPALSGFIRPGNYDFHLEKQTVGVKNFNGCWQSFEYLKKNIIFARFAY